MTMQLKSNLRRTEKENGQIILFVLFVVLLMFMFVALFISQIINTQVKIANNSSNSMQAYYYSDACTENVIYLVYNGMWSSRVRPDDTLQLDVYTNPSEVSNCVATVNTDGGLKFTIVGKEKNISSRAVQLTWPSSSSP